MTPNIDQHTDEHDEIVLLLPWYVNQTLEPAEQARVKAHVRSCLECRRELQNLGQLEQALQQPEDPINLAARVSFRQLQQRISASTAAPAAVATVPSIPRKSPARRLRSLTGLALAASLVLMAMPLALHQWGNDRPAEYQTLSNRGAAERGDVRVVFAPSLPFVQMDQMVRTVGGEVVGGPNTAGAYTIRLTADDANPGATVDFLRHQPGVLLAEPVLRAAAGE
jgi:hypothetical protein